MKLPAGYKQYIKYGLAVLFVYLTLTVNMASASEIMKKDIYFSESNDFLTRLTPEQYNAAEWALNNIPEDYNVSILGIPHQPNFLSATAKKIRWFAAVAQHPSKFYYLAEEENPKIAEERLRNDYIVLDYTMLGPVGDQETFNRMQELEQDTLSNKYSLLYNQNNIRVYKLE